MLTEEESYVLQLKCSRFLTVVHARLQTICESHKQPLPVQWLLRKVVPDLPQCAPRLKLTNIMPLQWSSSRNLASVQLFICWSLFSLYVFLDVLVRKNLLENCRHGR